MTGAPAGCGTDVLPERGDVDADLRELLFCEQPAPLGESALERLKLLLTATELGARRVGELAAKERARLSDAGA